MEGLDAGADSARRDVFAHDEAMATKRWAGLLRAVNVGGRKLAMADLRRVAEEAGFTEVKTLLASGNVVFSASGAQAAVREQLEKAIKDHAGFAVEVLLRSKSQLQALLDDNPFADGKASQVLVCFLDASAPAGLAERLEKVAVHERIQIAGTEVWLDCVDGIGKSKLAAKLPSLVKPRIVTARNVNTVTKLVDLL